MGFGSPRYISFNGVRFGIPAEAEIMITKGGRYCSEVEAYGDGIHVDIETQMVGIISDLVVRLDNDNGEHDRFDALAKERNLSIVFQGAYEAYQGTGRIVTTEGVKRNSYKGQSDTFMVKATRGQFTQV